MATLIECPSGFSYYARKLRGSEANLFTDKTVTRKGHLISRILAATAEDVADPGPYKFTDRPTWDKLLTGDRISALIQVRIATYTAEMEFYHQCTNETCRRRFPVDVDLIRDLNHLPLSEDDRTAFEAGDLLRTHLLTEDGDRREVEFHLMVADDERKLMRIAERAADRQITMSLAQRINTIQDVERNDIAKFIGNMELGEMTALVDRLDGHDCGVDLDIEVECEHCDHFMEVAIPLGGKEFFLPTPKRTTPAA